MTNDRDEIGRGALELPSGLERRNLLELGAGLAGALGAAALDPALDGLGGDALLMRHHHAALERLVQIVVGVVGVVAVHPDLAAGPLGPERFGEGTRCCVRRPPRSW